jgi:hypothetical protein
VPFGRESGSKQSGANHTGCIDLVEGPIPAMFISPPAAPCPGRSPTATCRACRCRSR